MPGVSEVSPVPEDSSVPEGDRTELSTSSPSSQCHGRSPEPTSDASRGPMPGQVSDEELSMLQMCLRRWREEVESDVRGGFLMTVPVFCHRLSLLYTGLQVVGGNVMCAGLFFVWCLSIDDLTVGKDCCVWIVTVLSTVDPQMRIT